MNRFLIGALLLVGLWSCGGSVSDEQRKQMLDARKQNAIVRITDAEIMEAAFSTGRLVMESVTSARDIDSAESAFKVKIHWLEPGIDAPREMEQQIIDAYIAGITSGVDQLDNVQRIGTDSFLYTKAEVLTHDNGTVELKGTWNIWISKKQLVLAINKK
jgi:hypothetical protein